jgi:hypothetical protein
MRALEALGLLAHEKVGRTRIHHVNCARLGLVSDSLAWFDDVEAAISPPETAKAGAEMTPCGSSSRAAARACMALAYQLASNGVDVTVLERHPDFDREFRDELLQSPIVEEFEKAGVMRFSSTVDSRSPASAGACSSETSRECWCREA